MEIRTLESTSIEEIVACLVSAFEDYFVPMPSDVSYWEKRYRAARVDFSLSVGVFEESKLIGCIIHGVDTFERKLTVFNTGTGIIKEHRGNQLVDKMYAYIIPKLKAKGVQMSFLEVIKENYRAIRVYERVGFSISLDYKCFKGRIDLASYENQEKNPVQELERIHNSWDNCDKALALHQLEEVQTEKFKDGQDLIGFLKWNPNTNQIFQCFKTESLEWSTVFGKLDGKELKFINVPSERKDLVAFLIGAGMENHIDQYGMTMNLES